ncbi:MAG: hypothetical protein U0805_06920 [Pirellulales bacterium]
MSTDFSDSRQELVSFHHFIGEQLNGGSANVSPEEALEMWRLQHRSAEEYEEDVQAIREALDDLKAGKVGTPVDEFITKFGRRHNIENAT